MSTQKERFMNMMTVDSEEYDICCLIGNISSDEDQDIVANLLYFELNDIEICNFFNKSGEYLLNYRDDDTYYIFQRTFNLIKYKMNEILRKRLGIEDEDDDFVVSLPDFSGNTYTYTVDLTDMIIYHKNSSGDYILNYEADTMAIEYLLSTDPDIHVRCGSSPDIIIVSRVITPIHTFVLRKI